MQIEEITEAKASVDTVVKARIDMAERAFINAQELSRFMDQKASYLLSAVALLTTALGIVAAKSLDAQVEADWQIILKGAGLFSFLIYIVLAFMVIFNGTKVFKALPSILTRPTSAPGMIFPLTLLERYKSDDGTDEEQYHSHLINLQPNDILRDYANQIVEISSIYQRKQRRINYTTDIFQYLSYAWIVTMILLLGTIITR